MMVFKKAHPDTGGHSAAAWPLIDNTWHSFFFFFVSRILTSNICSLVSAVKSFVCGKSFHLICLAVVRFLRFVSVIRVECFFPSLY